jgi:plasmid maintenance system antidote protein VapI
MEKIHYTPVHPGEVLRDELEEIGLTQSALAKHIGVLPKTINEICHDAVNDALRSLAAIIRRKKKSGPPPARTPRQAF